MSNIHAKIKIVHNSWKKVSYHVTFGAPDYPKKLGKSYPNALGKCSAQIGK